MLQDIKSFKTGKRTHTSFDGSSCSAILRYLLILVFFFLNTWHKNNWMAIVLCNLIGKKGSSSCCHIWSRRKPSSRPDSLHVSVQGKTFSQGSQTSTEGTQMSSTNANVTFSIKHSSHLMSCIGHCKGLDTVIVFYSYLSCTVQMRL